MTHSSPIADDRRALDCAVAGKGRRLPDPDSGRWLARVLKPFAHPVTTACAKSSALPIAQVINDDAVVAATIPATMVQGGTHQRTRATNPAAAMMKSRGVRTALVQTGS